MPPSSKSIQKRLDRFGEEDRSAPTGVVAGSVGFGAGGPVWLDAFRSKRPPFPYELVNEFKAVAYACIRLNSNGVSKVPLRWYVKTGKGQARPGRGLRTIARPVPMGRQRYVRSQAHVRAMVSPEHEVEELVDHPLCRAFENPNPYFDGNQFLQWVCQSLDVVGSMYLFPDRPGAQTDPADLKLAPETIWGLQSQYVYAVKGYGDEILKEYRYFGDTFHPSRLVRIRYVSLRDPYLSAYSPLHACYEEVGLGNYYIAVVESIMKTGARPSGIIGPKDANMPFGDDQRRRLEVDINNRFTGGRSGHILVTNGSYEWNPISYPPADLAGLKISEWVRLLVANCFDVPISLLQAEDTNRAVASEGTHQHQAMAVEPRCRMIASAITKYICQPIDPRIFCAFDDPVARDKERDAKVWDMKIKNGTATPNEARCDEDEEMVPWGNEPWMPNSLVQPSQAVANHEAGLAAQQGALNALNAEKDDSEDGDSEDDSEDLATKDDTTQRRLERILCMIEEDLIERRDIGAHRAHSEPVDQAPEDPFYGRSEHVWTSDRGADQESTLEEVEGVPESDLSRDSEPSTGDGATPLPPADDEAGRLGPDDDSLDHPVLEGSDSTDEGSAGDISGVSENTGRMGGSESAPSEGDPSAGGELLPEHIGDD